MRKILAFLLACVLIVSVIGTVSAAEFSDASKISVYDTEAVEILSALKVITGFPDGTFKPTDILTRAQAAKILCCIALGNKAADALPAGGTTFSDVPATHWANKYVEYCASKSIVAGVGEGKFNPDGKLTGFAFGKMLLVALGADGSQLTGPDWDKNTKIMINEKHLYYGVSVTGNELSRQDACRLALNALFDGEKDNPDETLAHKSFGVTRAFAGNDTEKHWRPITGYVSSEDSAYWPGVEKKVTASPVWFKKTGMVKGGTLVKELGVTDIEIAQLDAYRNSVHGIFTEGKNDFLHEGNTNDYYLCGNGVRLEVYYAADTNKWTIIHLFYFAEKITDVTPASYYGDGTLESPGMVTFEGGKSCPSNEFTKDDIGNYALIYGSGKNTNKGGKSSMNTMLTAIEAFRGKIVSGKLTAYDKKTGLSVGGKTYSFPTFLGNNSTANTYLDNGGAIGDDVKVLLSDDGLAIAVWQ